MEFICWITAPGNNYFYVKVEREKEAKRKVEARRIEIEIGQELKRPIEDMALAQDK